MLLKLLQEIMIKFREEKIEIALYFNIRTNLKTVRSNTNNLQKLK